MYSGCIGKQIVFIGGSTTRHLANHFIIKMSGLPINPRNQTHILNTNIPGWNIINLKCDEYKGYGCMDCFCASHKSKCHYDWVDFIGFHKETNTKVTFSWKPDLYREADVVAFYTRFLHIRNAIVFIGKGLHDAVFDKIIRINPTRIENDIRHMSNLVKRFDKSVKVFMRTPYPLLDIAAILLLNFLSKLY